MLVASYNNKAWDDLLIIQLKPSQNKNVSLKSAGNVTVIYDDSDDVIGINIFSASQWFDELENGPIALSEQEVTFLNNQLDDLGIDIKLEADPEEKFVVGHVEECRPHEDSDHLNITKTRVAEDEVLQIVCGAKNIAAGQKVVVAKPGAIMPDGLVIWPGELRGVASYGMICSAKELGLPKEKQSEGILVLPETAVVGSAFKF